VTKPFDASLNALVEAGPADWVNFLAPKAGLAPGPAEVLDTDLSVTAQADKAFRLAGPSAAVLHVELEGNPFGSDNAAVEAAIRAIQDPARLTRMETRLLHAASWDDLLATP
jgi:hypothetical protein